jgi:hypothetical protein
MLNGRASYDARSSVGSLIEEQFPFRDAVGVAEERRHRQFLRRARLVEQLQASFVRQTVALAGVHVLARPHEVFPSVRPCGRKPRNPWKSLIS